MLFQQMAHYDHEEIIVAQNRKSGLQAIISIHDTTLGPAVGGIRALSYSSMEEALTDVLKLSRAMTYKCAAAGINAGGGKTVLLTNDNMSRPEAFRALGAFIDSLGGRYYAAGDLGTTLEDLNEVRKITPYVEPLEPDLGAVATARGVFWGLKSAVLEILGKNELRDIKFAIQGLGEVGYRVTKKLVAEGADLVVTDLRPEILEEAKQSLGVKVVQADEIYKQKCDVFCPCGAGGTINDNTIEQLDCTIVAGAANNQLYSDTINKRLAEKGIFYVPDFVINAGGVLQYVMWMNGDKSDHTPEIGSRVQLMLRQAVEHNELPIQVAHNIAEERLKAGKTVHDLYWPVTP